MSETELRVQAYIAAQNDSDLDALIEVSSAGPAALLEVVKALGPYLTSEEDRLRERGVSLLGTIVARMPQAKMNRHATRTMLAFFLQKLEDTETVIPALKAILTVATLPTFSSEDVETTCTAIFAHVKPKAHVQSTRLVVYQIIDACMAKHRDTLKAMGETFVRGYISMADGEKDPRNLVLSFALVRVILLEFNIDRFVDSLFDITFCYFPITFTPPPDDPYGITADDLKDSLRLCLSGSPRFGPLAIPLFLEKITAGSPATKRETMKTMAVCWPIYGARLAQEVGKQVWDSYKIEIFQPIDAETQGLALTATKALITALYGADKPDTRVAGLAQAITEECLKILREPEKSQAKPASMVISALVETTLPVARTVIRATVTHLMGLFLDPDEASTRPAVLAALAALCTTIRKLYDTPAAENARDHKTERLLEDFKDQLLGAFTVELTNAQSSAAAIDGLRQLVLIPELLSNEELGFVVHNLNELLQTEGASADGEIRTGMLDLFLSTAKIAPKHIEETTLPLLFSQLPDGAVPADSAARAARALATLRTLCIAPVLFETLVIRLLVRLELCEDVWYALAMLGTLQSVLQSKIDEGHVDVAKYVDSLVPKLYEMEGTKGLFRDVKLVEAAAGVVTLVARTLTVERQKMLATGVCKLYLHNDSSALGLKSAAPPPPFEQSATGPERNPALMFSAALVPLRAEVQLPVDDVPELLQRLIAWSQQSQTNDAHLTAAMNVLASVINKHADTLKDLLSATLPTIFTTSASNSSSDVLVRQRTLKCWTWIATALVVRNHPLAMGFVEQIFSLFGDPDVSFEAATALGSICGVGALIKQNHAILRILHAQRFFNAVLPRIMSGAQSTQDVVSRNASLVALTTMVRHISPTIYGGELVRMMPLLIRGLDLPDLNLRLNVIQTLQTAAKDLSVDATTLAERAPALAETMLKTAALTESSALPVRVAAIRYLGTLPSISRYETLHPVKNKVVKELGKLLDDPKRSVRKEAVDAREKWYLLSA